VEDVLTRRLLKEAQVSYGCKSEPVLGKTQHIACPYSAVSRIEMVCDGVPKAVYLKRVRDDGIGKDAARRRVLVEYQILTQLFAHFQTHQTWGVARPIAVFPDELAIVTEEVRGIALTDLIGRSAKRHMFGYRQPVLEKYCVLAGTWLREFQSFTTRRNGEFNIQGLMQYCDQRLDTLIAYRRAGIDDRFKAQFRRYLNKKHEQSRRKPDIIVGRHNDFSPHNIIVEGDRISVIDFGFFDHDSYLYDVCKFWFQLECMKTSPLFRPSTIERLQNSFFVGYGNSIDPRGPAFEMVASRYYLTRLVTMVKEGTRGGLRGWIDRRSYEWCLQRLIEQCETN